MTKVLIGWTGADQEQEHFYRGIQMLYLSLVTASQSLPIILLDDIDRLLIYPYIINNVWIQGAVMANNIILFVRL